MIPVDILAGLESDKAQDGNSDIWLYSIDSSVCADSFISILFSRVIKIVKLYARSPNVFPRWIDLQRASEAGGAELKLHFTAG